MISCARFLLSIVDDIGFTIEAGIIRSYMQW